MKIQTVINSDLNYENIHFSAFEKILGHNKHFKSNQSNKTNSQIRKIQHSRFSRLEKI